MPGGYPWGVLKVQPNASLPEIKAAFRRRALVLHPDRNRAPSAPRDFKSLVEAYNDAVSARKAGSRFQYGSFAPGRGYSQPYYPGSPNPKNDASSGHRGRHPLQDLEKFSWITEPRKWMRTETKLKIRVGLIVVLTAAGFADYCSSTSSTARRRRSFRKPSTTAEGKLQK